VSLTDEWISKPGVMMSRSWNRRRVMNMQCKLCKCTLEGDSFGKFCIRCDKIKAETIDAIIAQLGEV